MCSAGSMLSANTDKDVNIRNIVRINHTWDIEATMPKSRHMQATIAFIIHSYMQNLLQSY